MKVREWIEKLSKMDPEYEVLAPDKNNQGKLIPVAPVETQDLGRGVQGPCAPFVKIVRFGE